MGLEECPEAAALLPVPIEWNLQILGFEPANPAIRTRNRGCSGHVFFLPIDRSSSSLASQVTDSDWCTGEARPIGVRHSFLGEAELRAALPNMHSSSF